MYLKSIDNQILFEGRFPTVKKGLEIAARENCNLEKINLRHTNLSGLSLDGAKMKGACLWGANLNDVRLNNTDLTGADFRTATLLGTSIIKSNCTKADFSGAYFSRVELLETDLSFTCFSCPSIFCVDLTKAKSLKNAVYSHLGEIDCALSHAPLIINGLKFPMVFMDDAMLMGDKIKKIAIRQQLINCLNEKIPLTTLV